VAGHLTVTEQTVNAHRNLVGKMEDGYLEDEENSELACMWILGN
jgi:hypothetical protein